MTLWVYKTWENSTSSPSQFSNCLFCPKPEAIQFATIHEKIKHQILTFEVNPDQLALNLLIMEFSLCRYLFFIYLQIPSKDQNQ